MEIKNIIKDLPYNNNPKIRWRKRQLSKIKMIIVHQELSNGSIESVNKFHITPSSENQLDQKNGAPHFAYHFGIRTNGEIVQCNEIDDITWHCKMHNTESIGIMIQGAFDSKKAKYDSKIDGPNNKQYESLEFLLNYLIKLFKLSKNEVFGHGEKQNKPVCPGDYLMKFIFRYRENNNENSKIKISS